MTSDETEHGGSVAADPGVHSLIPPMAPLPLSPVEDAPVSMAEQVAAAPERPVVETVQAPEADPEAVPVVAEGAPLMGPAAMSVLMAQVTAEASEEVEVDGSL